MNRQYFHSDNEEAEQYVTSLKVGCFPMDERVQYHVVMVSKLRTFLSSSAKVIESSHGLFASTDIKSVVFFVKTMKTYRETGNLCFVINIVIVLLQPISTVFIHAN